MENDYFSVPRKLHHVLDSAFFGSTWRNTPTVFRGAAHSFLPSPPQRAEVVQAAKTRKSQSDGSSIWFLEGLTEGLSGIYDLCRSSTEIFEWSNLWCDVFLTKGSSSIGAHLDDSDNFSIQLEGAKSWYLASPDGVSAEQRRLRILGEPDMGSVTMTDSEFSVTLQPGDVLYIPLMWRHWGISEGNSLSVSLVINSHTVWHATRDLLDTELRRNPDWTEPLHIGPGGAEGRRKQISAALQNVVTDTALLEEEITSSLNLQGHGKGENSLAIDMNRVKEFIAKAPPVPRSGFLLPDEGLKTTTSLQALLARKNLKHLLKIIVERHRHAADSMDRIRYQVLVEALLGSEDVTIIPLLTHPELTSWIKAAKKQSASPPAPRGEDPLVHQLLWFLMPHVTQTLGAERTPWVRVPADSDGRLFIPHLGLLLESATGAPWWKIRVTDHGPVASQGSYHHLLTPDSPKVTVLPRIGGDGPRIVPRLSPWLTTSLPSRSKTHPANTHDVTQLVDHLNDAAVLLQTHWPTAWHEFRTVVDQLTPVRSHDRIPYDFSVPAFRGPISSTLRPDIMAAQVMVHESSHNRMNTLLELLPLCENPDKQVIIPTIDAERTLPEIFHGAYSCAREVHLTGLLVTADVLPTPSTDVVRHLRERTEVVRQAQRLLLDTPDLTLVGATILDEIDDVLNQAEQLVGNR